MDFNNFLSVTGYSQMSGKDVAVFALLLVWALIWKGIALWKAARNGSKWWYVAMLVLNTVGLLEILYIFVFSKRRQSNQAQ